MPSASHDAGVDEMTKEIVAPHLIVLTYQMNSAIDNAISVM